MGVPFLSLHPEIITLKQLARRNRQKVFLVGGFLRDQVLGRSGRDLDFAVSRDAVALARRFARAIRGAFVLLDREAGCARVARKYPDGLWTYDFADFRARTIGGDLAGRDFTINTLTFDVAKITERFDPARDAVDRRFARRDMKARVIRMVRAGAFRDDPLRLLRAYSLMAQLGFRIEAGTKARIRAGKALLTKASPERVREELFKVLASPRAGVVVKAMDRDGILFGVMPQVRVMYDVVQGGYHHLDVWQHSLETLVQLEKLLKELSGDADLAAYLSDEIGGGHSRAAVLKLACLLHDIGKPDTRKREPGGHTSFHGHEHAGRRIARIIARQLVLSTRERYALEDMVTHHLRPGYLSNFKRPSDKAVYRYFRDTKEEAVSIVLLAIADQRATRGPLTTRHDVAHHEAVGMPLIREYFARKKARPFVRLIGGDDLIRELKLEPGPFFSTVLGKIEEAQHLGKITTREQALALAGRYAFQEGGHADT